MKSAKPQMDADDRGVDDTSRYGPVISEMRHQKYFSVPGKHYKEGPYYFSILLAVSLGWLAF